MDERLRPYAGRWVALVGDQVVGVGQTADAAQHLAQANRPRERLRLHYVDPVEGNSLTLPALLTALRPFLTFLPQPLYLVGGVVRDALLGRSGKDLDFVVPQDAIKLTFQLANQIQAPAYPLDRERDTGRIVLAEAETMLDIARFRGEDLTADLRDRDFTVNAMALPANATTDASLIDPTGGLADLRAGMIRQTHPEAIARDPVRALRGLRLSHALNFTLETETAAAIAAAVPLFARISSERIRDELLKLLTVSPADGVQSLHDMGLLAVVLPELAALVDVAQSPPHHEAVLAHTVSVLRWLQRVETAVLHQQPDLHPGLQQVESALSPYAAEIQSHLSRAVDGGINGRTVLILGALFHDVGKATTQSVEADGQIRFLGHAREGAGLAAARLRQLCFSNKAVEHVAQIVEGHMRPLLLASSQSRVSRRAVYRFFRDTQSAGLDVGLLALADHLATFDGVGETAVWERLVTLVADLFHHYFLLPETVSPTLVLDGTTLMAELGLAPGPEIGRLLRVLAEAQASGEISTREEALAFLRQGTKKS